MFSGSMSALGGEAVVNVGLGGRQLVTRLGHLQSIRTARLSTSVRPMLVAAQPSPGRPRREA